MLLEAIQARTKVSLETLESVAASASKRYKVYNIPKKTGGERTICHPSRPLKSLQRWLTRNLLSLADVHSSAMAYEKGSSIRANALHHAGTSYTLRMDFSDFFPSFDDVSIKKYLEYLRETKNIGITDKDILFAVRIFCRFGSLTIGAPSSPKLTNAMMFDIDSRIAEFSLENNLVYTRYADDIFISSFEKGLLSDAESFVSEVVVSHTQPILKINSKKTLHLSKAHYRSVTGLVLTPQGHVSLGRDRKREIRSLVYKAINGSIEAKDRGYLTGMIAFAQDVEPEFIVNLSRKFETDVREWVKSI